MNSFQISTCDVSAGRIPRYVLEVSYNEGVSWHEIFSSPVIAECHRRVITCKFDGERLYRIRDDDRMAFWQT